MSSGVSEQMKLTGNTGKNVEERNIPWSQQVDEASYENLALSNVDDNSAAHQSSMQFQYPPFIIKDNQNFSWNDRSRKPSNNFDNSKKYGKPMFQNSKRDDMQPNVWNSQNTRRIISDNPSGNFHRANRLEDNKLDNRSISLASIEERKIAPQPTVAAPKKTTWASIASQPAKLASRTTLMTSSHKKKGPGMPPPPMVPGKHNLDVNTWDVPNNNPPPVPSPPPPIDLASVEINPDFSTPVGSDHLDLGARPDKGYKGNDYSRDDNNKTNYNNTNFGRVRNSPNGHSRKNWSTQHPLHQNRQTNAAGNSIGMNRQNDSGNNGGLNRYIDRRPQYNSLRREPENITNDFRDENSPRNNDIASNIKEITTESPQAVIDELRDKNNYNPSEIDLEKATKSRFFVIKSYSEDDIHRSIKYEIWCSTDHGNKRLDDAFKERQAECGHILLFFSVNGSGHFCGMAQMMTAVDYNSTSNVWSQDKWKGKFKVKWIYVKDVPNTMLRNIYLENNENKPVTKSRDTQEVPNARGIEVLQIVHKYNHTTSIFDDFFHYEERQEKEVSSKKPFAHDTMRHSQNRSPINRNFNNRQIGDRERYRDRDNRGGNGAQKYYSGSIGGGGGSGGSGGGGGGGGGNGGNSIGIGNNFRERNNSHRGSYHNNYNDRRFEMHRSGMGPNDYQQKDKDNIDNDRENNDYGSRHNNQRFDYNRRDDTTQSKQNARERDFSEDYNNKTDSRFRTGAREMHKDNEYQNSDRNRSKTDY